MLDSLVSVIIVNYNTGALLSDCVTSALPQVAEVIVVDNASHDDSLALLERAHSGQSRLKVIRNGANLGFAAACNIGSRAAVGTRQLFLNPDCILAPDAMRVMLTELERAPDVGMVGGFLLNADGTEQGGGRRAIPTPWRSFVRAFGLHRLSNRYPNLFFDFYLHKQPLPAAPIEVEAISGACMLVKKEAVDDVGLWDEGYFLHCEDLDWCMRFRQKGWKILFVPAAWVTHALGVSSRSRPVFVEWHKHKGMMRFYRKFFRQQYPGPLMLLVGLGIWSRFAVIAGVSLTKHVLGAGKARRG